MTLFNAEAAGFFKGMGRPGYFFIDVAGTIKEKFFEPKYRGRCDGLRHCHCAPRLSPAFCDAA
jgi:hypothetical protein